MLQTRDSCWRTDRRDHCQETWVTLAFSSVTVIEYTYTCALYSGLSIWKPQQWKPCVHYTQRSQLISWN